MRKNILISRSKDEIIKRTQDSIIALQILIDDGDFNDDPIELKKVTEWIENATNEIEEIYEDRYYLVDNSDENKVIIDFWKEFNYCEIIEDDNYITVRHTIDDEVEELDVFTLINYNGNKIIDSCLDYEFVGNNIKALKREYVGHGEFYEYWEIDGIEGKFKSIDYFPNHEILFINKKNIYSNDLDYVGYVKDEGEIEFNEDFLIFKRDKLSGVFSKGTIILEPIYTNIDVHCDYGGIHIFLTKKGESCGVIVLNELEISILYRKEIESNEIKLIAKDGQNLLVLFYQVGKFVALLVDLETHQETKYDFDQCFQLFNTPDDFPDYFFGVINFSNKYTEFVIYNESSIKASQKEIYFMEEGLSVVDYLPSLKKI